MPIEIKPKQIIAGEASSLDASIKFPDASDLTICEVEITLRDASGVSLKKIVQPIPLEVLNLLGFDITVSRKFKKWVLDQVEASVK